jgi:homoserine kinase
MERVFAAAREAGAYGAFLSGAGSTILAFSPPGRTGAVAAAMQQVAEASGLAAETMVVAADNTGARVS